MTKGVKIGVVASEFLPAVGGMEQHALGLSRGLADYYDVTVYTTAEHLKAVYDESFTVRPVLTLDLDQDSGILASASPDFWLVLNAGYSPLAGVLEQPVFVYCHGNDFLKPWIRQRQTSPIRLTRRLSSIPRLGKYADHAQWLLRQHDLEKGLRAAARVYVNSHFTYDLLATTFPRLAVPVEINTPAVANHFFDNVCGPKHSQIADPDGPLRLLTVARLSSAARQKNVDNVIRAVAMIAPDHDVRLRIAGDGDLRREFEELAQALSIADRIEFLGNVSSVEVQQLLTESDLFVLPSKESFGMAYVEAAACGVPSVASATGATDAMKDGVTGLVIDAAAPDDIAAAIIEFIARRDDFDANSMRDFARRFTWQHVTHNLMESMGRLR